MGKIIDFNKANKSQALYDETFHAILDSIDDFSTELTEQALQMAMCKAWKEWDAKQPVGAILDLNLGMLEECADPRVRAIMALVAQLQQAIPKIKNPE